MNTGQIITITILCILALIGYFGIAFSKRESIRILFLFLLTFVTSMFIFTTIIQTLEVIELEKQLKQKCPQYEKVDNVYKLK